MRGPTSEDHDPIHDLDAEDLVHAVRRWVELSELVAPPRPDERPEEADRDRIPA